MTPAERVNHEARPMIRLLMKWSPAVLVVLVLGLVVFVVIVSDAPPRYLLAAFIGWLVPSAVLSWAMWRLSDHDEAQS